MSQKSEAALIQLGINPGGSFTREEIEDALEEAIYQESNYFLRRDFSSKLASSRIRKLQNICHLEREQLGFERMHGVNLHLNLDKEHSILELVNLYSASLSEFKINLTQAKSACTLIQLYELWQQVYNQFSEIIMPKIEDRLDLSQNTSKIRTIDFVGLIQELERNDYSNEVLNLYQQVSRNHTISS